MTIHNFYVEHGIVERLQIHMLRVACVAQLICEHCSVAVPTKQIILACLLHDVGNMVRFDGEKFLYSGDVDESFFAPEGREFRKSQSLLRQSTYGHEEHQATHAFLTHIGVSQDILLLVEEVDVYKTGYRSSDNLAGMIMYYADTRVSPGGVVTIEERIEDAAARGAKWITDIPLHVNIQRSLQEENTIFSDCSLTPEEICPETIEPMVTAMKSRQLPF